MTRKTHTKGGTSNTAQQEKTRVTAVVGNGRFTFFTLIIIHHDPLSLSISNWFLIHSHDDCCAKISLPSCSSAAVAKSTLTHPRNEQRRAFTFFIDSLSFMVHAQSVSLLNSVATISCN